MNFMILGTTAGFQLTHSRGVRLSVDGSKIALHAFQLTHSRGVRPLKPLICHRHRAFQLTHSRGVRLKEFAAGNIRLHAFQLTHSRGVRLRTKRLKSQAPKISTHALTWSATQRAVFIGINSANFNSRTHVECDGRYCGQRIFSNIFQLTHSRGVRRVPLCGPGYRSNFNSRTHVECDMKVKLTKKNVGTFQLTHSRGVRLCGGSTAQCSNAISTHALTWSATHDQPIGWREKRISTHALTWSATISVC